MQKIKITLGELLVAKAPLTKIANANLPVRESYWMNKSLSGLNIEYKRIEETRVSLIKKGGVETGGSWSIDPNNKEAMESYVKSYNELMMEEIEVEVHPIPLSVLFEATEFNGQKNIPLTLAPTDFMQIEKFIINDLETEPEAEKKNGKAKVKKLEKV